MSAIPPPLIKSVV